MNRIPNVSVRRVLPRLQVLVSVAALAACVAVLTVFAHHDYVRTVLWGGAILTSAVGWGAIVARFLYGSSSRVDCGLLAALGMAFHLLLGGILATLSLVSVRSCYAVVALGVALFALEAGRCIAPQPAPPGSEPADDPRPVGPRVAAIIVIFSLGVAVLHYLGAAAERPANIIDDYQAYFSFPNQLLATGTLIEPFSSRRIDSYGGQSYLQALVLAFSTVYRIGLLDNGICFLVLAGLVIGWVREKRSFPFAVGLPALLGLLTLHYYDLNHNAASEFSGAVFFLACFRILDRPRNGDDRVWPNAVALALVASAASTLRQSNLAAAALIPAAYYAARMVHDGGARRRWANEAALAALLTFALLLPWMVLAYRSSGTPLYPLILGNGAEEYVSLEPISNLEKARYFVMASLYPGRLPGLLLVFVAGLLVPRRVSPALRASLVGSALATILLLYTLAAADAVDGTDRYIFPFGLAYFLAVLVVVSGAMAYSTKTRRYVIASAMVVGALVLPLIQTRNMLGQSYAADANAVRTALTGRSKSTADDDVYMALQNAVPEHAAILVMLDQPFRLDFRRNRILLWDQPGAASPAPHVPVGQGPEALAEYLLGQGVRYVAYCDGPSPEDIRDIARIYRLGQGVRYVAYCDAGTSSQYKQSWENFNRGPAPPRDGRSNGPALRHIARLYMDIFANLQKLSAMRKQIYADRGMKVLDLATRALTEGSREQVPPG